MHLQKHTSSVHKQKNVYPGQELGRSAIAGPTDAKLLASYPGPHAERGRGPGDTWQNSRMCTVRIIA